MAQEGLSVTYWKGRRRAHRACPVLSRVHVRADFWIWSAFREHVVQLLSQIRRNTGPRGDTQWVLAELELDASVPMPSTGSLLALPGRALLELGGQPLCCLFCANSCGNTIDRVWYAANKAPLLIGETAVKSYFPRLGISSMLLCRRDRDRGAREGLDSCPRKNFLWGRIYFAVGYETAVVYIQLHRDSLQSCDSVLSWGDQDDLKKALTVNVCLANTAALTV